MPSTILSDNGVSSGSAGLKTTAASDGALALQTTTAGGSATTAVTIDTSQNVGVGVTPSAWASTRKALQISPRTSVAASTNSTYLGYNWYQGGVDQTYIATAAASLYELAGGSHIWYNAPSGTAGNPITFTQAMTLDASGNLRVANTAGTYGPLFVGSTSFANPVITIQGSNSGGIQFANATSGSGEYNGYILYNHSSNYMAFATNAGTERARIDSSGNLLVGITSTTNLPGGGNNNATGIAIGGNQIRMCRDQYAFQIGVTNTGANVFLQQFFQAGTNCGNIVVSNSNATAYQTSSDYRLKDNPQPMVGALDKVAALKPCTWTWKNTGDQGQGFIAHELQEICPDAVSGEKDAMDEDGNPVYQGIDTSFLVATLTAAIQELKAIVDAQAAEIAALKGN